MSNENYICPFCGIELKRGNGHHLCNEKKIFLENLDINELKQKYVDEEYSILDLGIYINQKYKDILYSIIPDCIIRKIVKTYLSEYYRNVKQSTNTGKKKKKYEDTMVEHFGCKHNFLKECSSRKQWEQKLFDEEGITNVFQRESVKKKIYQSLLNRYGSDEEIKRIKGIGSTKEGFQKKYGDDWEYYWNIFIKSKQTMLPDFYQQKYGDDWEYYWNQHIEKCKHKFKCTHFNDLNKKCYEILKKYNIYFEQEFPIRKEDQNIYGNGYYYFYDIKIENLLIELNGTYWHCDPRKYNSNDIVKFPNNVYKKVQDIWDKDMNKINFAKKNGFFIETIWEDDFSEEIVIEILKKYNLWNK